MTRVSLTLATATLDDMHDRVSAPDRTDPGVRAALRVERLRARDRRGRKARAWLLVAFAFVAVIAAAPITGDPGATVGAITAGLLCCALARAVWPYEWSAEELRHHEVEAIWREVRTDADLSVRWERYAAWAEPRGDSVVLVLITCAPVAERIGGAPSAYSWQLMRQLDATEIAAAAEAMEGLRADACERELQAQQRHEQKQQEAKWESHERALREIDEAAAADLKAREHQLEREHADEARELAEQAAAERKAQAQATARALRRP